MHWPVQYAAPVQFEPKLPPCIGDQNMLSFVIPQNGNIERQGMKVEGIRVTGSGLPHLGFQHHWVAIGTPECKPGVCPLGEIEAPATEADRGSQSGVESAD